MKDEILNHFQSDFTAFYSRFLHNVSPIGNKGEYEALCPFHDDHKPSFNFNSVTGFFRCYGCPKKGDIFSFYAYQNHLDVKTDFQKILAGIAEKFHIGNGNGKGKKQYKPITAKYNYVDQSGNLLYQVCRHNPKHFTQRRLDGKGGIIWNITGVKQVIYRLPEVMKAQQVLIVEGEKDCDNLSVLGFTATCNSGGAGKWKDEYSDYLKDKDIIIFPDQDEPGRRHGDQVAASLKGKARSIKMIQIAGVKDVSDFIATFKDDKDAAGERLSILIDSACIWEPKLITVTIKEPKSVLSFPAHIMTGAAGHFAQVFSEFMEPPKHFFFMAYLACLGSILAGRVTLNSELKPQPRLFMVLLGESADDRKSTAISKTVEFFQTALTDFRACFGVNSAEGLQGRFTKDNNLILIFDELKAFVGKSKVDGSVLLPCVCTLYESNYYESHTKNKDIILTSAFLSILAASTVQTYERCWDSAFQDIGMTNRLFIVPGAGKRAHAIPRTIDPISKEKLKSELSQVLSSAVLIPELDVNPDAMALYESWYMTLEQSVHTKRLDTYALRLMILLTVNAQKHEIDKPIVRDVIDLMNWQLEVRRLHDPIDADGVIAKTEEKIRRVLQTRALTDRDLKRAVHYNRIGIWVFDTAMKNLLKNKEVFFQNKDKTWQLG